MKRTLALFFACCCLAACGRAQPEPEVLLPDAAWEELAERAAALLLPEGAQTQPMTAETAALLLDVPTGSIARAAGFAVLDYSTTAQLMLLEASGRDAQELHRALEHRLELLRQTAEAVGGAEYWQGFTLAQGRYAALAVADNSPQAAETVRQVQEMLLEVFAS